MKYTRRYDVTDPVLADAEAIRDIVDYLGDNRTTILWRVVQECNGDRKAIVHNVRFAFLVAGVEGRPVRAYMRAVFAVQNRRGL